MVGEKGGTLSELLKELPQSTQVERITQDLERINQEISYQSWLARQEVIFGMLITLRNVPYQVVYSPLKQEIWRGLVQGLHTELAALADKLEGVSTGGWDAGQLADRQSLLSQDRLVLREIEGNWRG